VEEFGEDNWEGARDNILPIYDADPGYAKGTAGQILYEAYIYIGDRQLDNEQYDEALLSFENAESIAIESQYFTLQIFEAKRKIAFTLGLLGNYREANSDFQLLIQEAGIKSNTGLQDTEILDLVYDAEVAAYGSDHENAYLYYREALSDPLVFSITEVYQVDADDYLLVIAREGDTLTLFIELANPEGSAAGVIPGMELSIPTWEN
jgi:tetratricopeptide (TPR) repeat protein